MENRRIKNTADAGVEYKTGLLTTAIKNAVEGVEDLLKEVRREDNSLLQARIYPRGDASECFLCDDESMLPQMMRDFWTTVGRRNMKCE